MSTEYAHDAHCNTAHTAGSEPCPPATGHHQLSRSQEAAAFHGMALNDGRPVAERLELALQALRLYERELEKVRQDLRVAESWARESQWLLEELRAETQWLADRYNEAQRATPTKEELERIQKVAGVEHDV